MEKGPLKIPRINIEDTVYRLVKMGLITASVFLAGLANIEYSYNINWVELAGIFIALRLLLALRLPASELKPVSYQRINVSAFLKKEVLYGIVICALAFLLDRHFENDGIAGFVGINFLFQIVLYSLWIAYNKLLIRPQHLRRADSSERTAIIIGAGTRCIVCHNILYHIRI